VTCETRRVYTGDAIIAHRKLRGAERDLSNLRSYYVAATVVSLRSCGQTAATK
jgi:hypothetical protein